MRLRRYFLLVGVQVVLSLLLTALAFAQGGTATMSGRVTDPSGAVISGANVRATNVNTNVNYATRADSAGLYNLPSLPPGTYQIDVEKTGFRSLIRRDVVLHVADHIAINFQLQLGAVAQTVTVQGGAPLVNTQTTSLGGLVEEHEISNLPLNGRNYIDLTLLQPGVTTSPNVNHGGFFAGTWFSSNGATIRSNNFMLDGAIMQDINNGSTANYGGRTLGLDGIQEYRVLMNAIPAEYGMTMGSQTIMVSRSGTNKFHGAVFEYLRNSAMDAANYFDKPLAANNFQRLPPYKRNDFGADFGGPIQKDKTFFYANFEGVRERLGVTTIDTVPASGCHGAAGATITNTACPQLGSVSSVTVANSVAPFLALYPTPSAGLSNNEVSLPYTQPDSDNFGQVRVDHVFSANDRMFGRYTIDDDSAVATLAFPEYFLFPRNVRHQYITVGETHVFSASTLNDVSLSFSRTSSNRLSPTPSALTGTQFQMVPGQGFGQLQVGGLTTFGTSPIAPDNIQSQNLVTLSDDVSYIRGTHSLKFGTLINQYRQYYANTSSVNGKALFANLASFLQGQLSSSTGVTPGSTLDRTWLFYTMGVYAQDSWQVRPNFTVNAGLRYEPGLDYYNELHGLSSSLRNPTTDAAFTLGPFFQNPTLHNFSPRLGFAWDVFGNGKTAVRSGAAIMYDLATQGSLIGTGNGAQPPFSSTSKGSGGTFTLPLTFSSVGNSPQTFDYYLKQPTLYTWNLTVEQQLLSSMALSVSYVGSRGVHLLGSMEANPNLTAACPTGTQCFDGTYWPTGAKRINSAWGPVAYLGSISDSTYNALQVSVIKRMSKGLQFQSSYTWSKLIDDAQGSKGDCQSSSAVMVDPYNRRYDRGLACFTNPQTWVFNYIYNLPFQTSGNSLVGFFTNGWSTSGIVTVRDGFPFSPGLTTERSNSGVAGGSTGQGPIDRPSWNPAFHGSVITGNVSQWFDPNAFILQPAGTLGNVGRNSLLGPGFADFDLSLQKDTKAPFLGEAGSVRFRVEAFNIFNHPNFPGLVDTATAVFAGKATDVTETPLGTAGKITSTAPYTSRQIELSLRLSF